MIRDVKTEKGLVTKARQIGTDGAGNLRYRVGVIGLGYVGLPLVLACAEKHYCVGFDLNIQRVTDLCNNHDANHEILEQELQSCEVTFSSQESVLHDLDIYIITVPTPISPFNEPDLSYLEMASSLVGSKMGVGSVVIYESTVYPGATEEVCAPILEKVSSMKLNQHFFLGYSPERVNPADTQRRITDIVKVTSGSSPEIAEVIDAFYSSFILAGTHRAESIKVAEASKVVENIQRDVNIALMNELATIFDELEISTHDVLRAAGTKWNFLNFYPGLVGGHCISVDPYYLTRKAQQVGLYSELILASRRVNNNMASFVVKKIIRKLTQLGKRTTSSNILLLGASFKENCRDFRNSKAVDLKSALEKYGLSVTLVDPLIDRDLFKKEFGIEVLESPPERRFSVAIMTVPHNTFLVLGRLGLAELLEDDGFVLDISGRLDIEARDLTI